MLLPRGILRLALCAARERSRYAMDGLHISRNIAGAVTVTATDGKRLVRASVGPETDAARELAASFALPDSCPGAFSLIVPTLDEFDKKGNVSAQGLLSILRDERKKGKATRKAFKGPAKPVRESFYPRPKRPMLPKLPKRAAFTPAPVQDPETLPETRESVQMRYLTARTETKAQRTELMSTWRMQVGAAESANASIKTKYADAMKAWKTARKEARKARDVVAFAPSGEGIAVSVTPGRVREMRQVDGHYPPCDDVIPKATRAHAFELIVDAKALELIALAWRAQAVADERATLGEQAGEVTPCDLMRFELEGSNVRITGPNGRPMSDACIHAMEGIARVAYGEGRVTIGFNPFFLAEMTESLHAALGVSGARVRLGIKSEQDAILVAPFDSLPGEAFNVTRSGVTVTGVLMPVNIR